MGRLLAEVDPEEVTSVKIYNDGEIEKHFTAHSYSFLKYRKGARGKLGLENEDMFIFTG